MDAVPAGGADHKEIKATISSSITQQGPDKLSSKAGDIHDYKALLVPKRIKKVSRSSEGSGGVIFYHTDGGIMVRPARSQPLLLLFGCVARPSAPGLEPSRSVAS